MKFLVFITLALSCLSCFSEDSEKERTCRIIFLDPPRDAIREVQLFDGVASRKIRLHSKNLSEVIKLPGGDLVLGMTPDPVLNSEDFPKGAPTVKIPAKVTDFYLIVVSDPENKILPLRMLPVDVADKKPKLGQTLWINLTPHAIKGELGKESLTVPPESRVIGEAPLPASGYYKAEFQYQANGEGEFLQVMRKSWWFDAKSKNLGFIISSGRILPRIFTLRDKIAPKKKQ
jgi:hypothetical protein